MATFPSHEPPESPGAGPTQRLHCWLSTCGIDDALAPRLRGRQMQAVLRLTPPAMAANVINAALLLAAFVGTPFAGSMLVWFGVVLAVAALGMRGWLRQRHRPECEHASPRAPRRAAVQAALLAAVWAWMPLAIFSRATPEQQLLVATVTIGMMCGGGFALATLPLAGALYVGILGVAGAVAIALAGLQLGGILAALLLCYCVVVLAGVWSSTRLFGARLVAEAEAERQNEVVGLLLRDFEENASDVLWEIGPEGRLRHVSARLAALFGLAPETLAKRSMIELLQSITPDHDDARRHLRELRRLIAAGAPFRDQPLAAQFKGGVRWWSLSAKPLLDEQGRGRGWRGVASDITEAHTANRRLTWLAHNDTLTGLRNRHQFRSELQQLLDELAAGAAAPPPMAAVLYLDLDHFKSVNDTLGHAVGDALLQELGRRMLAAVRRTDTVARLGGDEFAVLQRQVAGTEEVELLATRLAEALAAPCRIGAAQVSVRVSMGVAMLPADGREVDQVLSNADIALYAAKSGGRGGVRFFAADMAASTRRRLAIEQALRGALAAGQLRLVYQPQVAMPDMHITGFEALLRWRHPELGEVAPAEFVPVAEESGLMLEIGNWVLAEACRDAARWPAPLRVSINVSPVQVMAGDLVEHVQAAAAGAGMAAERLEIEITESAFLHEGPAAGVAIHALHAAGFRLALDDFGTGHSALAYLRRYPFDTLKIDRSFVRELLSRGDARAIVRMIVGLGHTLRMQTVAEGVEEPAQASVLADYGCAQLQGFLVSRPVEASAVAGFVAAWAKRAPVELPRSVATQPMALDV